MTDLLDDLRMAVWTICVADLEEATRFYCEGLGFTEGQSITNTIEAGSDMAKGFDIPSGKTRGRFVSRPDAHLYLLQFEEPRPVGGRGRKPTNQIGPRSIIFTCSSPKAIAKRLEDLGGKIVHEAQGGPFEAVLVTDPDGSSIQLENLPFAAFEAAFKK